jgi:hypothetical protein
VLDSGSSSRALSGAECSSSPCDNPGEAGVQAKDEGREESEYTAATITEIIPDEALLFCVPSRLIGRAPRPAGSQFEKSKLDRMISRDEEGTESERAYNDAHRRIGESAGKSAGANPPETEYQGWTEGEYGWFRTRGKLVHSYQVTTLSNGAAITGWQQR